MTNADIDSLAKIIWDYHHMNHSVRKADCILVLGSNDIRVAERGAELFQKGFAPLVVFSGGTGRLTAGWEHAEADLFARHAMELGVPAERILIENQSRNTGENILFTRRLLEGKGLDPGRILLVQKPYMERRAYATAAKVWPDKEFTVTSPVFSFDDYPTPDMPKNLIIHIMVGDLQRIREYPKMGFQIPQEIPPEVWAAYERLVALGFTDHLVRSS